MIINSKQIYFILPCPIYFLRLATRNLRLLHDFNHILPSITNLEKESIILGTSDIR